MKDMNLSEAVERSVQIRKHYHNLEKARISNTKIGLSRLLLVFFEQWMFSQLVIVAIIEPFSNRKVRLRQLRS